MNWDDAQRLISEQKFAAASKVVETLREQARADGDVKEWTRAIIEEVKLRTALHGYETAIRFLKDQEWPDDEVSRAILNLYYANSLVVYVHGYSWEIRQRERVDTSGELDLKTWDLDRIVAEANRAFAELWERRDAWGAEPLGLLTRYIQRNNYPPQIRSTLRDAVTYLWVELLADTSLWRPDQSNELFRLDLESLITGDSQASAEVDLEDPGVHPLLKISALLDDIEAWHRGHLRPEAAHEARLERLRRLHAAFSTENDRLAVRHHLEQVQARFDKEYEWWSMGQSLLAEFIRDESSPDALVRARKAARAGRLHHPESVGGRRCDHIAASIEAPQYQLEAMAADGPQRRSIRISHRNIDAVHLRAYPYDLERRVKRARDYNLLPARDEIERILARGRPAAEWTVELPPTPDYRSHATYSEPPLERPGAYVVVASARRDFREAGNERNAVNFLLTNLVLVTRDILDGYEATARSGESGRAIPDAAVTLYRYNWQQGHQEIETAVTDAQGCARFDEADWEGETHFLLARWGEHLALDDQGLRRAQHRGSRDVSTAALIYTDRSVYRPQQTLYWKVVAYRGGGKEPDYRTLPRQSLTVTLFDANGERVTEKTVATGDFGSASGTFEIPSGRLLGQWSLQTSIPGLAGVRVEEYRRPTFEVSISDAEAPLRLNRPAALAGEARYYFGLPVASGAVQWRVTREPVFPRWWWWGPPPGGQSQVIASGAASLDANGRFDVAFTPEADERQAKNGVTYRYLLNVDVTDEGGETRSASRAFRLGFVAVEARFTDESGFLTAETPSKARIVRSDLDGTPLPGKAAWRLIALNQPDEALLPADQPLPPSPLEEEAYRTPGDELRPRWNPEYDPDAILATWPEGKEIADGALEHGDTGAAEIPLPAVDPGAYRIVYTTKDPYGATFTATRNVVVAAADGTPLALPAFLRLERNSVAVGETARLFVHSALPDQEMVLEFFRDGRRTERRAIVPGQGDGVIEIPIGPEHRGGFGVSLTLLRDHQLIRRTANLFVPWDDRRLKVEFATFRDRLRPGTRETFRVTVRGNERESIDAATAELLAYMYDRSLDIFAPHTPPDVITLYPSRTGVGGAWASLERASIAWSSSRGFASLPDYPHLRGDLLEGFSSYGIGGPGGRRRFRTRGFAEVLGMDSRFAVMAPAAAPMEEAEGAFLGDFAMAKGADMESLGAGGEAPQETAVELRADFSETAFWEPHLLLASDGSATIEFQVPDSVTDWNVWVHAVTTDLRGGSVNARTQSVKELMVRPYLPRFLREGDTAVVKVVVNNAGETPLEGALDFEIVDPETDEDLRPLFALDEATSTRVPFSVEPGKGADLGFPIRVPTRVGTVAFRVTARAGDFSDGELRPLPVLPGRMHLVQSKFATLHDRDRRELRFDDMAADDDPSMIHDQLVVTVDAQLFYSVLNALPYLVNYPYECTEQTLNRFLSTGIATSLYADYPAVARMAEQMAKRETRLETWDAMDPNRKMMLEETPWLVTSRGGDEEPDDLINVLDPRVARAERSAALAELRKAQTSLGAFPWWPGGPPSPYMTLYILHGFSKALEFGVEAPQDMVVRAWSYMHRHYIDELVDDMMSRDCCWEMITFLNYVLSCYPDDAWTGGVFTTDDRARMLDFSFRHWKEHAPLLKGYLALTLDRSGRRDDAKLVFDSVMDSAKTDPDLGTYWAPEDRAWLWYNDTIETHAFALRTLAELDPRDGRRHGLVHWLLLNKKLNHWKSTRATAEVLYSLAHYLKQEGALAVREEIQVGIGSRTTRFVFEPDRYTGGRNRVIIAGPQIDPKTMATVVIEKETKGFAFASATWHFSTERLPEEARGDLFGVTREYFRRFNDGDRWVLRPLADGEQLEPGDQVEVHLSIRAKHAAEYVHLRDPRGAGFEPETLRSQYKWDLGISWYEEVRDSGTNFFFEWLPAGEYTFKYRLRAAMAGAFRVGPATLQSMYAPEFAAYSAGHRLEVAPSKE